MKNIWKTKDAFPSPYSVILNFNLMQTMPHTPELRENMCVYMYPIWTAIGLLKWEIIQS
jgi:hypothetical protein